MKKILLSLSVVLAVAAVVLGATTAFFSDTETSTGNTFTAGAIDLKIDNESYYSANVDDQGNLVLNTGTSWLEPLDLNGQFFFNFRDLKPGDWGEDTISLHVNNNDSWLCADVKLTSDDDNDVTEPEDDELLEGDTPLTDPDLDNTDGELADHVNFYWWADDGDNVFECVFEDNQSGEEVCNPQAEGSETLLPAGPLGNLSVGQTATVDLADADDNIWGDSGALPGGSTRYIGKAWCFGESDFLPYPQGDDSSPVERPVTCDGSDESNITQTDSMTADISFRAVQSRNNEGFECNVPVTPIP